MGLAPGMTALSRDIMSLDAAVHRGDLASARTLWLKAHLLYTSLGGGYGLFGPINVKLDGLPGASSDGVRGPGFTGFHGLEYLLWNRGTQAQLEAATTRLVQDVEVLKSALQTGRLPAGDFIRSSREILETAARVTLSGDDDFGSHSGIATLVADAADTRQVLQALSPLLQARDPDLLSQALAGLTALTGRMENLRRADGSFPPLPALSTAQRRQVDAAVARELEILARVPTTLQVVKAFTE